LAEYSYYLVDELRRLSQIGHIDVVADVGENNAVEPVNDKVTLHHVWKIDHGASLIALPLRILSLKPDVIHFNLHMAVFGSSRITNFIGLSLPFLCSLMGFRTLVTLHNITEMIDVEKAGFRNTFLNRLGALIATKLLTLASAITVTVRPYVKILKDRYRCKKALWIPHGTWKTCTDLDLDPPSETKRILYMGHSGPYKDLDLLFEAFSILKHRKGGVKLIIAGSSHPNYPGFLKKYKTGNCSHDIEFTGYVPDDQLPSLFEKVDVAVLPYHTCTGTSGVAHLLSSYGVPIVATDLPEFRNLFDEGCGIIFSSHDPDSLAERIEQVLDKPDLARELGERSLRFAQGRTWDKIASLFCTVYKQIW